MNNTEKIQTMRNEKIPRVLLKLGIPTMIGMMVSALYSVVDAYFVGWLGTSQMGAVSVVFPIVQIIVGLGMTFGSGAASYISRLLGRNKIREANETASTALFASLFVGVMVIATALCFLDEILLALGATETILPYARDYAVIYITGSILNIFNVTMNNTVTAEGRAKLTMIAMMIGGGLNVLLDPLFVMVFGWGVRGAAIATVTAQAVTSCMYLWFILSKKGYLRFSPKLIRIDKKIYGEVLKVGLAIFVYQVLTSIALSVTNNAARPYGDSALAAVGVVTRILTLGTYVVFGYTKGYQPVAGYNYGAKQYGRMKEATGISLLWTTVFCAAAALVITIFPRQLVSMFSQTDFEMIAIGTRMLRANGFIFPLFGFQMVYMSFFLSLGRGKEGGLLSISRQGLFFIPVILLLSGLFGMDGIIWAQPVADVLTVILTAVFAVAMNKRVKVLQADVKPVEGVYDREIPKNSCHLKAPCAEDELKGRAL